MAFDYSLKDRFTPSVPVLCSRVIAKQSHLQNSLQPYSSTVASRPLAVCDGKAT